MFVPYAHKQVDTMVMIMVMVMGLCRGTLDVSVGIMPQRLASPGDNCQDLGGKENDNQYSSHGRGNPSGDSRRFNFLYSFATLAFKDARNRAHFGRIHS